MTRKLVYNIYQDIKSKKLFIALNRKSLIDQYKLFNIRVTRNHIENYVNYIGFFDEKLNPHIIGKPIPFNQIVKEAIIETFQDLTK